MALKVNGVDLDNPPDWEPDLCSSGRSLVGTIDGDQHQTLVGLINAGIGRRWAMRLACARQTPSRSRLTCEPDASPWAPRHDTGLIMWTGEPEDRGGVRVRLPRQASYV